MAAAEAKRAPSTAPAVPAPRDSSNPSGASASTPTTSVPTPAGALAASGQGFPISASLFAVAFGALLVVVILAAVLVKRDPFNTFQQFVIRTVLALGCALVSMIIPGFAYVGSESSTTSSASPVPLYVGGPMAVFFVVFLGAGFITRTPEKKE